MFATHWQLGDYILYCTDADELLFTENETNAERCSACRRRRRT